MSYSVSETATVLVDHEALSFMITTCSAPGAKVGLVGFNEYSKHLLNLTPDSIVCIYDEAPWKWGIMFRDKTVVKPVESFDLNTLLVCDYGQLYGFGGAIRRLYRNAVPLMFPPRLHYIDTAGLNIFKQDALYRNIDMTSELMPVSMMNENKLQFLAELMRVGLKSKGDILEMGVYQGGSVWYLAHVLRSLNEQRKIYMMDLFEQHMMHPNATMCTDEIVRRLSFYPYCQLIEGLVDDEKNLSQLAGRQLCFVHYDLGFHQKALRFAWDQLQPGCPLVLDNYGHMAIEPWDLDDFFATRGAHVLRNPWSEQGVVIKPASAK